MTAGKFVEVGTAEHTAFDDAHMAEMITLARGNRAAVEMQKKVARI